MLCHNAMDSCQPQSSSFFSFLGGKERLKNTIERSVVQAAACVGDSQENKVSGSFLDVSFYLFLSNPDQFDADGVSE